MSAMSVGEAIAARRSIRRFRSAPLSDAQIEALLEAARLAPSAINCQPWRFKLVRDRETLDWLAAEGTRNQRWVGRAPAVFVCCADLACFVRDQEANLRLLADSGAMPPDMLAEVEGYVARNACAPADLLRGAAAVNCAIAITQMMLQAVDLGLGSTWIGMFDEPALKARLGLPADYAVIALLAVGVPSEDPPARSRKALGEILVP
ncbi:MAG: nitroreductase family protein [Thermodesulfobacteriota bacterium]